MKVGDLVHDDYGNTGLVIETGLPAEMPRMMARFFLVQFPPEAGYNMDIDSHYERDLELVKGE